MSATPRDEYLAGLEPPSRAVAAELARIIEEAAPQLTARIAYKMLMYIEGTDRRHFVVAVDRTSKVVALRFLYGAWLSDPANLLRHGSSHLSTIDIAPGATVDADVVAAYVREAASGHAAFKARAASEGGAEG